ncbi:secretory carrier-associated membrane protein 1-like isoform X1 [Nilaparvata lugens]|uniref:secretory carrier-associated membrane protein 1-like isoform X1 n=2 Tax=Nilaparvata lugens TaxID=108931 RepID=UPI000B9996AC|nr:secretory carrier-associated membrane protein 1-like isoform X1 [Nilaparvata lugens]
MSGFDENPFGEPTLDNPFADPAIQQVTNQTTNVQRGLDEYNPFADQPSAQRPSTVVRGASNPPGYGSQTQQPAIMHATQELPPPYSRTAQQQQAAQASQFTTAELQRELERKQEELERKAAELARREAELRNAPYNVRRNNWPPLPENCCGFQPCFYQDINVEIPTEFQTIVRHLYYLWLFHACLMIVNVFGGLLLLVHHHDFGTMTAGIVYTIIFTPFSYLCWFRPAYKAFRNDSSFNFMVFFFIFFIQFIITVIQTLGMPGGGTCGLATAIMTLMEGTPSGIVIGLFLLVLGLGFGTAALLDLLLLTKVHRIYRSTGASFAKAQQEFTSEFLRNEHVRTAAGSAMSAAVSSQFQPSATTPPAQQLPRY